MAAKKRANNNIKQLLEEGKKDDKNDFKILKNEIDNLREISVSLKHNIRNINEELAKNYDIYNLISDAYIEEAKNFYSFTEHTEIYDKLIESYCRHKNSYLTSNFYDAIFCLFKQLEMISVFIDNFNKHDESYMERRRMINEKNLNRIKNKYPEQIKRKFEKENSIILDINNIIIITFEIAKLEKKCYFNYDKLYQMKTVRNIYCHGILEKNLYENQKKHLKYFNDNKIDFYYSSVKVLCDYVNCIKSYF